MLMTCIIFNMHAHTTTTSVYIGTKKPSYRQPYNSICMKKSSYIQMHMSKATEFCIKHNSADSYSIVERNHTTNIHFTHDIALNLELSQATKHM